MSVNEVKQLLIIANNRPESREIVFKASEDFIKKNLEKIPRKILPEMFFYFSENNYGSPDFYSVMESKLIEYLHNIDHN